MDFNIEIPKKLTKTSNGWALQGEVCYGAYTQKTHITKDMSRGYMHKAVESRLSALGINFGADRVEAMVKFLKPQLY